MKIIKTDENNKTKSIQTEEISIDNIINLNNKITKQILKLISQKAMYPKQIAKALKLHEQNIYYYIKKLEKSKIIKQEKQENINGTIANFYTTTQDSLFIKFKEFEETTTVGQKESKFLKPFIEKGKLNALIVVGSPDPHGPQKARARDGYFGMDLALFLGSFLTHIPESHVRLDTEVSDKELEENNLIVLGGPIVNKVTGEINKKMPIYFDNEKGGIYSKISKKNYYADETGIINKIKSPYNKEKAILFVAGIRNSGTKSAILAFLKNYNLVKQGNLYNEKYNSKVVEGIDMDSDGVVDSVEFLE